MTHRVGDSIFRTQGVPGVVTEVNPVSGELTVATKGNQVDDLKRRGYINGLSPQDRGRFNQVVDEVRELEDPHARVQLLTSKLTELSQDPRNHILVRYLKAELSHTMNTHQIYPQEYRIDENLAGP